MVLFVQPPAEAAEDELALWEVYNARAMQATTLLEATAAVGLRSLRYGSMSC